MQHNYDTYEGNLGYTKVCKGVQTTTNQNRLTSPLGIYQNIPGLNGGAMKLQIKCNGHNNHQKIVFSTSMQTFIG